MCLFVFFFFFQAEDGIRDGRVTGVQTCALPIYADAEADLADREGLLQAATLAPDHDTLEHLDAGPVTLDDLDVHLDGVTGPEVGDVVALARVVELVQDLAHQVCLFLARATGHPRMSVVMKSSEGCRSVVTPCGRSTEGQQQPILPHRPHGDEIRRPSQRRVTRRHFRRRRLLRWTRSTLGVWASRRVSR